MAQVYVGQTQEWYQALAGLKNHDEKYLEASVLKYAQDIFDDYITFQSGFTFTNVLDQNETSDPDIILIGKNFQEWVIMEMELMGKPLHHTRKQLRVFSNPAFDINSFVAHCMSKDPRLKGKESQLKKLFKSPPQVTVVFDTYSKDTLTDLQNEFRNIKICVFEIYRTFGHALEVYRFSGNYPYIKTSDTLLKFRTFELYEIKRPNLIKHLYGTTFEITYCGTIYKATLQKTTRGTEKWYLNIPNNSLPVNRNLFLQVTLSNKLIIDII